MSRRSRSLDSSYAHRNLLKPLTPAYWHSDTVTAETREAAEAPVEAPAEAPKPAQAKKPRTKRAKPVYPTKYKLQFSPEGECLGLVDVGLTPTPEPALELAPTESEDTNANSNN